MEPTTIIRPATLADLPAITDIYNEAILTTTATFMLNLGRSAGTREPGLFTTPH